MSTIQYQVGDKVRIIEQWDENYGRTGTVLRYDNDDDSYLIEFETEGGIFGPKTVFTDWYYGTSEFVHANKPTYKNPFIGIDLAYCDHEWREDKFFTKTVYRTCKKCGKKAEDV